MSYYAVKIGKVPGVYRSWDECKRQVHGFKGAIYKKFESVEEAKNFVDDKAESFDENLKLKADEALSYVDGSFRNSDKSYSYGLYLEYEGKVHKRKKRFTKGDWSMRNVSGEIEGAMAAMTLAKELGAKKLYLHYDYEGIRAWALGNWKRNREGTKRYHEFFKDIKDELEVVFIKVKAHSNIELNELVDQLAKEA